jgi:hypothetical protein
MFWLKLQRGRDGYNMPNPIFLTEGPLLQTLRIWFFAHDAERARHFSEVPGT